MIVDVDSERDGGGDDAMGLASLQAVGFSCGFDKWELIRIYSIRHRSVVRSALVSSKGVQLSSPMTLNSIIP